jgi:hypothetical protein
MCNTNSTIGIKGDGSKDLSSFFCWDFRGLDCTLARAVTALLFYTTDNCWVRRKID